MPSAPQTDDVSFSVLQPTALEGLITELRSRNYRVIAPVLSEGAIELAEIGSLDDLPVGVGDEQSPGRYRVQRDGSPTRFGFAVGPQSLKKYLHPAEHVLWRGTKATDGSVSYERPGPPTQPLAFVGIRACDLHAVLVLDKVFLDETAPHETYAARRDSCFFVAVDCAKPASTCFCTAFGEGPDARAHYDLALTELVEGNDVIYLARSGSAAGADLLQKLDGEEPTQKHYECAHAQHEAARAAIGTPMETKGLPALLQANPNHPRWDEVAARCLTCGNCTQVCPTCFCSTQETRTTLNDPVEERVEKWDSCFTLDFTQLGGGIIRQSPKSRYRQWMTHKLSTWVDQFDTMGCVGCGRCISWCPVGIDIRDEVAAIQGSTPTSNGAAQ